MTEMEAFDRLPEALREVANRTEFSTKQMLQFLEQGFTVPQLVVHYSKLEKK